MPSTSRSRDEQAALLQREAPNFQKFGEIAAAANRAKAARDAMMKFTVRDPDRLDWTVNYSVTETTDQVTGVETGVGN